MHLNKKIKALEFWQDKMLKKKKKKSHNVSRYVTFYVYLNSLIAISLDIRFYYL